MFDLKNRTKNDDLRESLNQLKCSLDTTQTNLLNEAFDNSIKDQHFRLPSGVIDETDYSDDEANDQANQSARI
jgi:hypothetical protein